MPVLINWKICDNSKDCSGIGACPTHALVWDDEKKIIAIDNEKCTNCGLCEKACPVGAIRVARTQEEYEKIQKEIDDDPRKVSDLFVDRYGGEPTDRAFEIGEGKFEVQILEATQLAVVEFFNEITIICLMKCIPIKELLEGKVKYRKIEVEEDSELLKRYGIKELPCLAFFRNGKLVGKVEGYYSIHDRDEMKNKIAAII